MAKAHYIGVDGVARKVRKQYVGVDGVARSVKNAYVGVDGVARQYFASGVKWKKYNCTETEVWAENPNHSSVGKTSTVSGTVRWSDYTSSQQASITQNNPDTWIAKNHCPSYTFSQSYGYVYSSNSYPAWKDAIGYYSQDGGSSNGISYQQPRRLKSYTYTIDERDGSNKVTKVTYTLTVENAAYCYLKETKYTKGSTLYGEVTAPENEYPENLTYVKGSLKDKYYVLRSGSTYYYYVLVEE